MTGTLASVWGALTGPRVEDSWVELLDADEGVLGALDGVLSCTVEHNVGAVVRGGCSLTVRDVGQVVDWGRMRVRPWVRVNGVTWPLGVFLPASPVRSRDEVGIVWESPCLDKMSILDQDVLTATLSLKAGTVATEVVADLIGASGESLGALTPSSAVTRSPMMWEPGTPILRIVNDLLGSINYFSLWADRTGSFRSEPYRRPQDRALAATFAAGEASILSPEWSREQDLAGVPNRIVLIVEGDDTVAGMVATATNTDPTSPYSTVARGGRIVARTHTDVEAADKATLNALAARYLADASTPSAVLSVSHAAVPLDGNAAVRLVDGGVDTLAVVESYRVDLAPGSLMSGTWREVVS